MKKITSSFLALVLLIIFSSIVYIWQAESEKEALVSTIDSQEETIIQLQKQIEEKTTAGSGEVSGVVTSTGSVLGTITFTQTAPTDEFIVCGRDIRTKQEYCASPETSDEASIFSYSLDIPTGRYEVFASLIQDETTPESPESTESAATPKENTEIYYSDFQICDNLSNCISDSQKKRFIDIIANEVQTDIDISL